MFPVIQKPVIELSGAARHEFGGEMRSHTLPPLDPHERQPLTIARQFRDALNKRVVISGRNKSSSHSIDHQFGKTPDPAC